MTDTGEMYRAGLPVLGARLLEAAKTVRPGRVVADIGCDHGKLAVWLVKKEIAPKVIAVDSSPMPLQRARALARQTQCLNQVELLLADGLSGLAPGQVSDIVIAGLSGETIASIIEACSWCRGEEYHFVLVPTSRHTQLRRWLCQNGFALWQEKAVEEKGRSYSVFSVGYSGLCHTPTDFFCEVGLLPQDPSPAARRMIQKRVADLRKQRQGLTDPDEIQTHEQLLLEVESCLM